MTIRERIAQWLYLPPEDNKASTGIGATMMTYGTPLSVFSKDPRKAIKQAQAIGIQNLYIRACERVIGDRFSTVPWHLEIGDGEEYENPEVTRIIERPYIPRPGDPVSATPQTRSGLWRLTSRHIGLTGISFWYLDQSDATGWPMDILYINPGRMTPAETKDGALTGWVLDADLPGQGVPLPLNSVLAFRLEPADTGHYGIGLVESAFNRVEMMSLAERHAKDTLATGGRLSGIFAPSAAAAQSISDDAYEQLKRDLRNISEDPNAARRALILKGPIEYTQTSATPTELDLMSIAQLGRDGILDLWGVPLSQLGGAEVGGLNSGESRKYEAESLWQNAVGPRLRAFTEVLQFQLLDRLDGPELVIEEPEFDDHKPNYELAQLAMTQPLTNAERRAIIGLEPVGDDGFDESIYLPINLHAVYGQDVADPLSSVMFTPMAPDGAEEPVEASEDEPVDETQPEEMVEENDDFEAEMKARLSEAEDRIANVATRGMARDLAAVFADMAKEVSERVERNAKHLESKPNDTDVYFDSAKWQKRLLLAVRPHALNAAEQTEEEVKQRVG